MVLGDARRKVIVGLLRARGGMHRYTLVRWGVGLLFTATVAWLPLSNTLRFDLWGGNHHYLGQPVDLVTAAKGFAFPFLAINVAIVIASRFVGRYLCGFVCPVGALGRFGEWMRWTKLRGWRRWARAGTLLLACCLLSAIVFSFWVDWQVFRAGGPLAKSLSAGFLGGLAVGLFVLVYWLGLRFCRDWCPSGVYFAVLGPETRNGIEFAHPENCTDCHACEQVCPSDLHPRELEGESRGGSGLYPGGMGNHALCLRCGDCVAACEGTTSRLEVATPLRMGWLSEGLGKRNSHAEDVDLQEPDRSAAGPQKGDR